MIERVKQYSIDLRKVILDIAYLAGSKSAHIGGALSSVEIISTIFSNHIKKNDTKKFDEYMGENKFILSKGHACLAYYGSLYLHGYLDKETLSKFEGDNNLIPGHPVKNLKLGIDFSTGSLGMGLSLAIGVAIAKKKKKQNSKVFVLLGDGECNEGSIWEGIICAPKYKLDNLYVVVDRNNFQQTGSSSEIMHLGNLKEKFTSFDWDAHECDGHDIENIEKFLNSDKNHYPKILVANTIKGKGVSFCENQNEWHHSILTKSLYEKAINEIV